MSDVKHTDKRTETHSCVCEHTETHACVCERTETHDLISRKAAIERIRMQMDRPDTFGWWTRNDLIAEACYKFAIEILERLPSAETFSYGHENDWIPISERLPEKNGYYLITDAYGDVEMSWFRYDFDEEEPEWWLNEYGFIDVVAWMPLPKPARLEKD